MPQEQRKETREKPIMTVSRRRFVHLATGAAAQAIAPGKPIRHLKALP